MKKLITGALCAAVAFFASAVMAADQAVINLTADNDMGYAKSGRYTTRNADTPGTVEVLANIGSKVTLKAYADAGYTFTAWDVDADEEDFDASKLQDTSLTVKASDDFNANANFIAKEDDEVVLVETIDFDFAVMEEMTEIDVNDLFTSASKATVSISGLPAGVKFDSKKMTISGTPSVVKEGFVKIAVKNASGVKKERLYQYSVAPLAWDDYILTNLEGPAVGIPANQQLPGDYPEEWFIETANGNVILTAKNLPAGLALKKYAKDGVYGYYLAGKATKVSYDAWNDVEFTAKLGKATIEPSVTRRMYVMMPRVQVNTIYVDEKGTGTDTDALKGGIAFLKPGSNYYNYQQQYPEGLASWFYFFMETGSQYYGYNQPTDRYGTNNKYMTYTSNGYSYNNHNATLTMTNKNMSVTDFFKENIVDEDYGDVKGPARYAKGQKVSLKANAKAGYVFAGWRVIKKSSFRLDAPADDNSGRTYYGYNGWSDYCNLGNYTYRLPVEIADVDLVQKAKYSNICKQVQENKYGWSNSQYTQPDYNHYWYNMYEQETSGEHAGQWKWYYTENVTYQTNQVDVVAYQPITVADFDARDPNYTFTMGDEDVTYFALFVKKSTDMRPNSLAITVKATIGTKGPVDDDPEEKDVGDYHYQQNADYSSSNPGTTVYEKNGFSDVDNVMTLTQNDCYYCMINNEIDPIVLSDNSQSLATYTVKGLPAGLKFNAKSGTITGTPTAAGKKTVYVKITNVNKLTTETSFNIWVAPLANYAIGTFNGVVSMGVGTNGTFTLTVDAKGNAKGSFNIVDHKAHAFACKIAPIVVTTKKNSNSQSTSYYYDENVKKSDKYITGDDFTEVTPYVQMYVAEAKVELLGKIWDVTFRITSRTTEYNLTELEENDNIAPYEFTDLSYDLQNNQYPYYYTNWDQKYWVKDAHGVAKCFIERDDDDAEYLAFATQAEASKTADLSIRDVTLFNYFLEKDVDADARFVSSTKKGVVKYTRMIDGRKVTVTANVVPVYGRTSYQYDYNIGEYAYSPAYGSANANFTAGESFLYYAIIGVYENESGDSVVDYIMANQYFSEFKCLLNGEADPFRYDAD